MPDYTYESEAGGRVAGVDEVGRGPLAGPVLAAAVVFRGPPPAALAALLDDSKKLSAARREIAFAALQEAFRQGLAEGAVAAASVAEIARLNILHASHLAMLRALRRLPPCDLALVDGRQVPPLPCRVRCLVGGDALSLSIAAASILAKVVRDRAMARLDRRFPAWGFARHQGYPTAEHRACLARLGPTPHHRRGFAPVDQAWLPLPRAIVAQDAPLATTG
ncbi:ribonuclease HII [Falsiroseomonas selenitidurans]|uniref:Ribonuclease HII n=1 Tax=Falsiroseomonas selenitidurans TaxID=2716335 RepID=A0ABX1E5Q3_9PROT|nr:ribonuclease HII [Falsiroseomonas selenitidurans]NKC32521.1 ribonuclease HII [Falsiroseomonas selenitidurans]